MLRFSRRDLLVGTGAAWVCAIQPSAAAPVLRTDDPRLAAVADTTAKLTIVYDDGRWCEGPCWIPERTALVFSDTRANRMTLLHPDGTTEPFRDPSDNANGSVLDAQGRLVTCEHRGRRVVRQESDGQLTVLADQFEGKPLNSPNDAVLAPDGSIWFTDPVFGIRQPDEGVMAEPEQSARRVYRIDPAGRLEARIDRLDQPNGLAFSPDGRTLYVSESGAALNPEGASGIWRFGIDANGGVIDDGDVFAEISPGVSDGLGVDREGRVFAACQDGVGIFDPDGTLLGRIATPTAASNVAFGGADGKSLFITAGKAVLHFPLLTPGLGF